jgi:hypothetical protein
MALSLAERELTGIRPVPDDGRTGSVPDDEVESSAHDKELCP